MTKYYKEDYVLGLENIADLMFWSLKAVQNIKSGKVNPSIVYENIERDIQQYLAMEEYFKNEGKYIYE